MSDGRRWTATLRTILVDVAAPIAAYFLLVAVGVIQVWALVGSAAISLVALGVSWIVTREISTLGVVIATQFVIGVAIAGLTGDPRLVLLKDYVITAVIAVGATASLALRRPFIARIRRDLSPDRERFDRMRNAHPGFRAAHRRLTLVWAGSLLGQAAIAAIVILSAPVSTAVVATNILTPAVILILIGYTETVGAAASRSAAVAAS